MVEKSGSGPRESNEQDRKRKIVELNDRLRTGLESGGVMMSQNVVMVTQQIHALEKSTVQRIFQAVREFDDFTEGNDPYGEHEFGAFQVDGVKCFWKIDYYDNDLVYHSPDESNPAVTRRVLTIMRAEEY